MADTAKSTDLGLRRLNQCMGQVLDIHPMDISVAAALSAKVVCGEGAGIFSLVPIANMFGQDSALTFVSALFLCLVR